MERHRWRWAVLVVGLALAGLFAPGLFGASGQAAQPPPPGDPVKGKAAWDKSCALCHGANGEGVVGPPLAGLAGHMERIAMLPGGLEAGLQTIRNGIPGRMPAFPPAILSDQELMDGMAYLMTLPPATGEQLYENPSSCAACHGKRGVGGIASRLAGAGQARMAALGITKEQLLGAFVGLVRNGIPGRMPASPVLTDGEIMSIGEYLWNLAPLSWEEQFAFEHGSAPTAEDRADREWSLTFLAQNGRPPADADWRKHFQDTRR